jgi:hypothetical protein
VDERKSLPDFQFRNANNVDELAQDVASAVIAEVDFYKSTRAVADDDLLACCTENLRFALISLEDGVAFDTAPAAITLQLARWSRRSRS